MAGNQTHGYDMAIQFSEQFFNQFLGATLDSPTPGGGSLLCQLLTGLGHPELCGEFGVNVFMSRPTDLSVPASARDFLDIHITAGPMTIRMVVGIATDRSQDKADVFIIDFQNLLHTQQVKIGSLTLPNSLVRPLIMSTFKKVPLPSIPLDGGRASTDFKHIIRADTRVIDDTSPANRNAWALLLTFGGGTPGDANAFTEGFIPPAGNGAVAVFFDWITRILSPLLASALGMEPDGIVDGHLVSPFLIDDENDVTLTQLDLTLEDGFIQLKATVTKSGFCYEARGTVTARLKLAVEDGHIIVKSEIDDPDISVDIPWYCYLAGAVIGLIIGGVLLAVVVPLVMWLASDVVNDVIDKVTEIIGDAVNSVLPNVDVAIPGLTFVINDAFIDDVLLKANVVVHDKSPIKCSGTVILNNGQYLDLDTGTVENDDTAGADIFSTGSGFSRSIKTVCRTTLARTWQKELANLSRFNCYSYPYQLHATVPMSELAEFDVWGLLWGDMYDEEKFVYAVVTNENRYSLFRVIEVKDTWMRIHYKTFGIVQSLSLIGGFTCGSNWELAKSSSITFKPSPVLLQLAAQREAAVLQVNALQSAGASASEANSNASAVRLAASKAGANVTAGANAAAGTKTVVGISGASLNANIGRLGDFFGEYSGFKNDTGHFAAQAVGLVAPVTYFWAINGNALQGDNGTVTVDGKQMKWAVGGNRLSLTPVDRVEFEFELKVATVDARGTALTKIKCIKYVPICRSTRRVTPPFKLYRTKYAELWGLAEVPQKNLSMAAATIGHG